MTWAPPYGSKCHECPFGRDGLPPHRPVLAERPKGDVLGLLVGEGPGREEVEQGRPFVGPTGRELDLALAEVGLSRSRLLVINATCCRPPPGKADALMRKACDACRPAFLAQLATVPKATPVFAMGRWARYQLTGKATGLFEHRGFIDAEYRLP